MNRGKAMAVLAAVCAVSAGMTATAYGAESTFEMKKKVVSLLGILTTSDRNAEVTREGFARGACKSFIPETELWSGSHRRGVCRRGCGQPVRLRHPDGLLQRVDERLSGRL